MNIGERIKLRRKQLKMSADDLAEKLGKNRATIYRYEKNEIENMPYDVIEPLAKALNVSPAYLLGWENDGTKDISTQYPFIPISISAGTPDGVPPIMESAVESISIPDSIMGKWAGSKDIYLMRVNGESMNNVIPHHSLIAIKQVDLKCLKDGDIVVYSDGHEYSVKRFYRHDDTIIFKPDSKDIRFTDKVVSVNNSDINIHGKVVVYIVELD